jgi:hypothetical protein
VHPALGAKLPRLCACKGRACRGALKVSGVAPWPTLCARVERSEIFEDSARRRLCTRAQPRARRRAPPHCLAQARGRAPSPLSARPLPDMGAPLMAEWVNTLRVCNNTNAQHDWNSNPNTGYKRTNYKHMNSACRTVKYSATAAYPRDAATKRLRCAPLCAATVWVCVCSPCCSEGHTPTRAIKVSFRTEAT